MGILNENPARAKFAEWEHMHGKYMMMDEVSMMDTSLLHNFRRQLSFLKSKSDQMFAGMNNLFFGADAFCQKTRFICHTPKTINGHLLWRSLNVKVTISLVVNLNEIPTRIDRNQSRLSSSQSFRSVRT
jgi:uncharacterized membrane protein